MPDREGSLEPLPTTRKAVCPDCGHFTAAHRPGEGCNRKDCECKREREEQEGELQDNG